MPRFADYHRTVVGYHGTRRSTALRVVQGLEGYKRSENSDDWLGHGVYFWEYAPQQAWAWAEQRRLSHAWGEEVAVLASMIRLGNCFDLLDPDDLDVLAGYRRDYEQGEHDEGRSPVCAKPGLYTCYVVGEAPQGLIYGGLPRDVARSSDVRQDAAGARRSQTAVACGAAPASRQGRADNGS